MLKKTMTYTDYNGVTRTEDFYFNLTKAEVSEMETSIDGGFAEMCQKAINAKNVKELIQIFKSMILKAYGEKSLDGRRFMKVGPDGTRLADAFAETEAYSDLFMTLATDADEASKFVNGILPKFEEN